MSTQQSTEWLPMGAAPKDGTCILLCIQGGEHQMQDEDPHVSIGSYGVEGGPKEDPTWHFAGWSWHQDCYCRGTGTPIGWLPLPPPLPPVSRMAAAIAKATQETPDEHR